MQKIYVVEYGQWQYEDEDATVKYFASKNSALNSVEELRADTVDGFYMLPLSDATDAFGKPMGLPYRVFERIAGKEYLLWAKGNVYSGTYICVTEESLIP